jgi:hypothetical protein
MEATHMTTFETDTTTTGIKHKVRPLTDFIVRNEGSIVLLTPITNVAKEWVEEHLPEDVQHWGTAIVVEPRYIMDILQGIHEDGLGVR